MTGGGRNPPLRRIDGRPPPAAQSSGNGYQLPSTYYGSGEPNESGYWTTPALVSVAMVSAMLSAITAWPWSMFAAFFAGGSLLVLCHINFVRPAIRNRTLASPVEPFFVVTSQNRHELGYVIQDHREHYTKDLTAPANTEDIYIQIEMRSKASFVQSAIQFGFSGELDRKPDIKYFYLGYIARGKRKREPETWATHIYDHNGFYHINETRSWAKEQATQYGFIIRTKISDIYTLYMHTMGEGRWSTSTLMLNVEDNPKTRVRCVAPHHGECFIRPREPALPSPVME